MHNPALMIQLVEKSVSLVKFGYKNRGKGCSQKEDSKTASLSQTQLKTLFE